MDSCEKENMKNNKYKDCLINQTVWKMANFHSFMAFATAFYA